MAAAQPRYRGWTFTVQAPDCNFHPLERHSRYYVKGREVAPTTGQHHLQCFIYWTHAKTFNATKELLPQGAHIERAQGTPLQNRTYCTKDEDFDEYGECPQQGSRNDIYALRESIEAGESYVSLYRHSAMWRYSRAAERYRFHILLHSVPNWKPVTVTVYWGDAGVGKTRKAYAEDPELYRIPTLHSNILWFDGYSGERAVLFDDFYGQVRYSDMLELLDGYRLTLQTKGAFTVKEWDRVYITSNQHPTKWYTFGCPAALARRITNTIHMGQ